MPCRATFRGNGARNSRPEGGLAPVRSRPQSFGHSTAKPHTRRVWGPILLCALVRPVNGYLPLGPKPKMLPFFCRHFPLVELNFTFYRPPTREVLERLADQTSPAFQFLVKLPRTPSHEEGPRDLPGFRKAVERLHAGRRRPPAARVVRAAGPGRQRHRAVRRRPRAGAAVAVRVSLRPVRLARVGGPG